ncbi:MAG TPA: GspMb/PilO family protein [Vicinamibacterales bacterium]|nr:GspMb/PilO family protein [Vicinamibacterales bacterium]
MTLWRRIAAEKRPLIVPLAAALLINIGVYAFVVYPLGVRSAGAATRAENAATSLRAAESDYASARALVAGTTRADQELQTFYGKVLPTDFPSARRLTYTTLPELAKKAGIRIVDRKTDVDPASVKSTRLGRLVIRVALQGEYESFRQFLYNLESAPEFVIVDDVAMEQTEPGKPLSFVVGLSTYYRPGTNGD